MRWITHFYNDVMRVCERMNTQEWLFALLGLVVVGWICLRGFGSRSSY
jgi:hypothetical protein